MVLGPDFRGPKFHPQVLAPFPHLGAGGSIEVVLCNEVWSWQVPCKKAPQNPILYQFQHHFLQSNANSIQFWGIPCFRTNQAALTQ